MKVLRSNDCLLQCVLKETIAVILLVQTQYTCQQGQQSMTILRLMMSDDEDVDFDHQAKYGDYDESTYQPGLLANEELLPQRVRT